MIEGGDNVDSATIMALARSSGAKMAFCDPSDDVDVATGQGTLELEFLDDIDDLAQVIVHLGGGLLSGAALALKLQKPSILVSGVQISSCAPYVDGDECSVAAAMMLRMEHPRLFVKGGGTIGVSALLTELVTPVVTSTACIVLSGSNVELWLIPNPIRRHETEADRPPPDRVHATARWTRWSRSPTDYFFEHGRQLDRGTARARNRYANFR